MTKYKFNVFTGKFDITELPAQARFKENGNDLELYWKDQLVQVWTYVPVDVGPPPTGSAIGLLLTLTHAN